MAAIPLEKRSRRKRNCWTNMVLESSVCFEKGNSSHLSKHGNSLSKRDAKESSPWMCTNFCGAAEMPFEIAAKV